MEWSLFFSIMLFIISFISVISDHFFSKIHFLNALSNLINESTGFLSIICIIAIIATIWKHPKKKKIAIFWSCVIYILDLAVINKLYLNATWSEITQRIPKIFTFLKSWNWPIILIILFCLAITIAMIIWGLKIRRKENGKLTEEKEYRESMQSNLSSESASTNPKNGNSTYHEHTVSSPVNSENQPQNTDSPSINHFWFCILLIIPAITFVQFIFYRILPLELTVPDGLNNSLDILIYISTICVGTVVVLFLWSIKSKISKNDDQKERLPATLAILTETLIILLVIFQIDIPFKEKLDLFLNAVADNTIAAFVIIPVVLFVILYVAISLFLTFFIEGYNPSGKKWTQPAKDKLDDIQQLIVMFALNVIIGILNLFLIIPDFFNEIGELLIDRNNLFPKYNSPETSNENNERADHKDTPDKAD